jgi:hypothetical protein
MSQELYYTSAPRGLLPGKSGFCTVAMTRQTGAALMERLESLSSYRPLFPPHHPQASLNPMTQAHLRISVGGRTHSLLSCIGPAGLDYTGRTNLFAHHVVLEPAEQPAGGPAWLFQQAAFRLNGGWQGEPRYLEPRALPRGDVVAAPCRKWQQMTGDAGWGGVLAERFEQEPSQVVYLIFEPGFDPLPLLAESLMLLPPERRWDATFSTYYTGLPPGVPCVWRCVANGSEEAKKALRLPSTINLCVPAGPASGGDRVEQARTGKAPRRRPPVAAVHLPSSPMPPPAPGLEKRTEPQRPRSRLWPFLAGTLAGMILMAAASGVIGYFFAVRPLLAAENTRKELEGKIAEQANAHKESLESKDEEIRGKDEEIQKVKKRLHEAKKTFAKLPSEWSELSAALAGIVDKPEQDVKVVLGPLEKQLRANTEKGSMEKIKIAVKSLLSSPRMLLGERLEVKVEEARNPEKMMERFFTRVDETAEKICKKRCGEAAKRPDSRDAIIEEIQATYEKLGNDRTKKAIETALKKYPPGVEVTTTDPKPFSGISGEFMDWYKQLFDFHVSISRDLLDCEKSFHEIKHPSEGQAKPDLGTLKEKYRKIQKKNWKEYDELIKARLKVIDSEIAKDKKN